MEQNKNYVYTIVGIGIIIVIGLFFWNMQTAESPVDNSENTQQEQEDTQNNGDEQEEEQQNGSTGNEDDTQQEGDRDNGSSGDNGTGTNGDTGETSGDEQPSDNDPTANWRTYENSSLGLTFKFPSDWRVTENSQVGEYTLQVYAGTADDKTTRVNMLIHDTEIDQTAEASAETAVNGQEAYVYTNICQTESTCVMNRTVLLREGVVNGGVWSGNVVEITAVTEQSETTTLRSNITNLISSVSLN